MIKNSTAAKMRFQEIKEKRDDFLANFELNYETFYHCMRNFKSAAFVDWTFDKIFCDETIIKVFDYCSDGIDCFSIDCMRGRIFQPETQNYVKDIVMAKMIWNTMFYSIPKYKDMYNEKNVDIKLGNFTRDIVDAYANQSACCEAKSFMHKMTVYFHLPLIFKKPKILVYEHTKEKGIKDGFIDQYLPKIFRDEESKLKMEMFYLEYMDEIGMRDQRELEKQRERQEKKESLKRIRELEHQEKLLKKEAKRLESDRWLRIIAEKEREHVKQNPQLRLE